MTTIVQTGDKVLRETAKEIGLAEIKSAKITKIFKKKQTVREGCLSVVGMFGAITRAEKITVEAYNEKGEKFTRGASGLLAQIFQHEMDHLNGILFTDTARNLEKIETK